MIDELFGALMRFHREVVMPDIERIVGDIDWGLTAFRDEMRSNFREMHKRFDRLDYQSDAHKAALKRIEERLA